MKNLKKSGIRGLAVLIALFMCVSMLPLTAFADDDPPTLNGYLNDAADDIKEAVEGFLESVEDGLTNGSIDEEALNSELNGDDGVKKDIGDAINEFEEAITGALDTIESAAGELDAAAGKLDAAAGALTGTEITDDGYLKAGEAAAAEYGEVAAAADKVEGKVGEAEGTAQDLVKSVNGLMDEVNGTLEDTLEKVGSFAKAVQSVADNSTRSQTDIDALTDQIEGLEQAVAASGAKVSAAEQAYNDAQTTVGQLQAQLETLETEVENAQSGLKTARETLKKKIDDLKTELGTASTALEEAKTALEEAQKTYDDAKDFLALAESVRDKLNKLKDNDSSKTEGARDELDTALNKLIELAVAEANAQLAKKQADKDYSDMESELEDLSGLEAEIDRLKALTGAYDAQKKVDDKQAEIEAAELFDGVDLNQGFKDAWDNTKTKEDLQKELDAAEKQLNENGNTPAKERKKDWNSLTAAISDVRKHKLGEYLIISEDQVETVLKAFAQREDLNDLNSNYGPGRDVVYKLLFGEDYETKIDPTVLSKNIGNTVSTILTYAREYKKYDDACKPFEETRDKTQGILDNWERVEQLKDALQEKGYGDLTEEELEKLFNRIPEDFDLDQAKEDLAKLEKARDDAKEKLDDGVEIPGEDLYEQYMDELSQKESDWDDKDAANEIIRQELAKLKERINGTFDEDGKLITEGTDSAYTAATKDRQAKIDELKAIFGTDSETAETLLDLILAQAAFEATQKALDAEGTVTGKGAQGNLWENAAKLIEAQLTAFAAAQTKADQALADYNKAQARVKAVEDELEELCANERTVRDTTELKAKLEAAKKDLEAKAEALEAALTNQALAEEKLAIASNMAKGLQAYKPPADDNTPSFVPPDIGGETNPGMDVPEVNAPAAAAAAAAASTSGNTASRNTASRNTASGNTASGNTASGNIPGTNAPEANAPTASAPTANAPTANAPTANAPTANAPTANAPTANAPTANAPTANDAQVNIADEAAPLAAAPAALSAGAPVVDIADVETPLAAAPTVDAAEADDPAEEEAVVDIANGEVPLAGITGEETAESRSYTLFIAALSTVSLASVAIWLVLKRKIAAK